jgi:hypothetical protein
VSELQPGARGLSDQPPTAWSSQRISGMSPCTRPSTRRRTSWIMAHNACAVLGEDDVFVIHDSETRTERLNSKSLRALRTCSAPRALQWALCRAVQMAGALRHWPLDARRRARVDPAWLHADDRDISGRVGDCRRERQSLAASQPTAANVVLDAAVLDRIDEIVSPRHDAQPGRQRLQQPRRSGGPVQACCRSGVSLRSMVYMTIVESRYARTVTMMSPSK